MFQMISDNEAYIKCPQCRDEYIVTLSDEEAAAIKRYEAREIGIQEALPNRDRSIRESFISGLCTKCWNKMFGVNAIRTTGGYFDIDNSFADSDFRLSYLVEIPTYEDGKIAAKVLCKLQRAGTQRGRSRTYRHSADQGLS